MRSKAKLQFSTTSFRSHCSCCEHYWSNNVTNTAVDVLYIGYSSRYFDQGIAFLKSRLVYKFSRICRGACCVRGNVLLNTTCTFPYTVSYVKRKELAFYHKNCIYFSTVTRSITAKPALLLPPKSGKVY